MLIRILRLQRNYWNSLANDEQFEAVEALLMGF